MRKINYLQVTITPVSSRDIKDLRVEVSVDGITHSTIIYADPDDFVSEFDFYIAEARREILRLIKQ